MATEQQSYKKCRVFRPQHFHCDYSKPSAMETTLLMYIIKVIKFISVYFGELSIRHCSNIVLHLPNALYIIIIPKCWLAQVT